MRTPRNAAEHFNDIRAMVSTLINLSSSISIASYQFCKRDDVDTVAADDIEELRDLIAKLNDTSCGGALENALLHFNNYLNARTNQKEVIEE